MKYTDQKEWNHLEKLLSSKYHFKKNYCPKEEWWNWKGNKVHLDTFRNPKAKVKVLLFHGVGTNGRQLSAIVGGPLSKEGIEIVAIDMPLYGLTLVNKKMTITYDDWIDLGNDYINYELSRDMRPIFLYGLSAGGMETYHLACKNKKIQGIIGMTFLDQRNQIVRNKTSKNLFWSYVGIPFSNIACKFGLSKVRIKMSICSKMNALCNNNNILKLMLKDKTSAGNCVSIKFINTYMNARSEIEPENFDICPILLTQPEKDRWIPLFLSKQFLDKINKVPVTIVELTNGSHYPVEEQALNQLKEMIVKFIRDNS